MPQNYTAYHVHTDFSLLDSASRPEEYVRLAASLGQIALGFSEHGNIRNWTGKKAACEAAGLKYIHAVEVYLTRSLLQSDSPDDPPHKVRDNYHTVLIAKNYSGALEINRAVSLSNAPDHFHYVPRLTFDEFLQLSTNVITTSACLASPLNQLQPSDPWYEKLIRRYDYLEIQPHACREQADYNVHLARLSERYGIPLIAGTDAHSSSAYKAECRDILMLYKGQTYEGEEEMDLTYPTFGELCDRFRRQDALPEAIWLEAIENTNRMAAEVEAFSLDNSNKYPILYGSAEEDERHFIDNVWSSLQAKLDSGEIPREQEQAFRTALTEELSVFHKIGMCGFMQSMSEIIRWCHKNGIVTGFARGSVGGSRAAYVTDVIDLNPETWHTVFSRFANEDRVELGDIDVDCVKEDRPRIFEHIIKRFGAANTARVPTYGTARDKAVIEIIVGAFRKRWTLQHPDAAASENPYPLSLQDRLKSEYAASPERFHEKHPEIAYYIDGLLEVKTSQSVHPAGIVISPITLADHYGTFTKDGESILQLDMDLIHDAGLVKYDMLVLRNVAIIRDACACAGIPYPKSADICWNDRRVWQDMLSSPVGIFQMEGDFAFQLLKRFRPRSIFDMSLVTAAIRPSGASYREDLIRRQVHKNPSGLIDRLLENNLGYLVYQEDIIAFLQEICGLSGSAADTVRRCIAKKQKDKLEQWLPKIIEGYCRKSTKPRAEAETEAREYLQVIEDASAYSFGYNHSVAYCLVGYLCAYLRCYYPGEFITSLLNHAANESDITGATALASERGFRIMPPRYGHSSDAYVLDADSRQISKGAASIKDMNATAARELYALSKEFRTDSFADLLCEIHARRLARRNQLEILIGIDYFSDFGNVTELTKIYELAEAFKFGERKSYPAKAAGGFVEELLPHYASNRKQDGTPAASYKFANESACRRFLASCEERIKAQQLPDIPIQNKIAKQCAALGYAAISSSRREDARRLYIAEVAELPNHFGGGVWKYRLKTIGLCTGKQSEVSVTPVIYKQNPIRKGEVVDVYEDGMVKNRKGYWNLVRYRVIHNL